MSFKPLLLEGATDAAGFLGGALLAFWLGQVWGFDIFAPGYGNSTMVGIVMVGLGGGGGLQLARALRHKLQAGKSGDDA
jgi:hypothetical protein